MVGFSSGWFFPVQVFPVAGFFSSAQGSSSLGMG